MRNKERAPSSCEAYLWRIGKGHKGYASLFVIETGCGVNTRACLSLLFQQIILSPIFSRSDRAYAKQGENKTRFSFFSTRDQTDREFSAMHRCQNEYKRQP